MGSTLVNDDNAIPYLPPGFTFRPTQIELVGHFLKNKILEQPIAFEAIPTVDDLYSKSPQQFPFGDFRHAGENEWYFYTTRPNYNMLVTDDGYYSLSMEDKVTSGNEVIGFMRILTYYQGCPPRGIRTNWIIHEFRVHPRLIPAHQLDDTTRAKIANFVACRVILTED